MSFDEQLHHLIDEALKEDIGDGDHSTLSCIPARAKGKAVLKIKQDGVLAGMQVALKIFRYKEPDSVITVFKEDGEEMRYGEKAFEVEASVHTILQCERLVLNCMQRMSGIATLTKQYTFNFCCIGSSVSWWLFSSAKEKSGSVLYTNPLVSGLFFLDILNNNSF